MRRDNKYQEQLTELVTLTHIHSWDLDTTLSALCQDNPEKQDEITETILAFHRHIVKSSQEPDNE